MPLHTCIPSAHCDNRKVLHVLHTRRSELTIAWSVAAGVAAVGTYDFVNGVPPATLLGLPDDATFVLFLAAGIAAAVLATARLVRWPHSQYLRWSIAVVSLLPALLSDPTYASLIIAIPLIDIRRRDAEPIRSIRMLVLLAVTAAVVVAEDTPRVTNEIEAMLGLGIALVLVVLLGDALRQLDQALLVESELAKLAERNRIAEELHDSLGHHLLAASVQLNSAKAYEHTEPARAEAAIKHASSAIAEAISETRLIVNATRAQDDWFIEPSIRDLASRIVPPTTNMTIQMAGNHHTLQPTTRLTIYRVVQEALTNLVRHSSATAATIASQADVATVTLRISDNGTGLVTDAQKRGGLTNMRRRVENLGGAFDVESSEHGTAITAIMPR